MYLPKADSGRLIVGTWWLVVLIFVTTYCGNLVAFLTFPKIDIPITTVNQLINNKHGISWGIKSGTFLEEYLKVNLISLIYVAYLFDWQLVKIMNYFTVQIVYISKMTQKNLLKQLKNHFMVSLLYLLLLNR